MVESDCLPKLFVIPGDLMQGVSADSLVSMVSRFNGVEVWKVSESMAFSFRGVLVKRGIPLDYEDFLKKTKPLFNAIQPHVSQNFDQLSLEVPGSSFWIWMMLRPEETNRRSCRYFKSELKTRDTFAFRAYASYELSDEDLENLRVYLTDWMQKASGRPVQGETLSLGSTELIPYTTPGSKISYPEIGFEVRCSDYVPCTWPWVDLYLRMRRDLPTKKRLSIRFFNRIDPRR